MTLGEKQEIFTSNIAKLINFAEYKGYKCRIREVQRTQELQDIYIRLEKSKTRNSKHLDSLAADIYFTRDGKILEQKQQLQEIGDYWESLNPKNSWGGNWKSFMDCPHFEMDKN